MLYRLSEDKLSNFKAKVYGYAGDVVKLVSRMGEIYIVEGKTERFSINKNLLIEMKDLEKFKILFGRDRVKPYPTKLEYRVSELDANLQAARDLISKHKLNLEAGTTGSLASYGAFEVKELAA